MKQSLYDNIISSYKSLKKKRFYLNPLCKEFPNVPRDTIESIISQEYQRETRNCHRQHVMRSQKYYQNFQQRLMRSPKPGFLLSLADEVGMSPALFAKAILEQHFKYQGKELPRSEISAMLKNTTAINEQTLAVEVHLCNVNDEMYGPITDAMRGATGKEYEEKLKMCLDKLGITYVDEEYLKLRRYDKTPDIKLDIPVAVDGYLVNWIESKALFGDEDKHKTYMKDQYSSYYYRFGPGLVIYWAGFIEELNVNQDQGVILYDHCPQNFVFMNPLTLMKHKLSQLNMAGHSRAKTDVFARD